MLRLLVVVQKRVRLVHGSAGVKGEEFAEAARGKWQRVGGVPRSEELFRTAVLGARDAARDDRGRGWNGGRRGQLQEISSLVHKSSCSYKRNRRAAD